MSNFKKMIASPWFSICSFILAAGLLLFAGIGGARAALQVYSDNYKLEGELYDIGITLNESTSKDGADAKAVAWRNYRGDGEVDGENADGTWDETKGELVTENNAKMKADGKIVALGKLYPEYLSVTNSGNVNEYVRATVYTYWTKNDKKATSLDPTKIHVIPSAANVGKGKAWVEDTRSDTRTDERRVFYYTKLLNKGATTPAFTEAFSVDPAVALQVTKTETKTEVIDGEKYTTFKTTYDYDGAKFVVKVIVDAVQEHNAQPAAISAWGPNISISGGTLSLKK